MIEIKYDLQVGQNFKIIERESDIHIIESKLWHNGKKLPPQLTEVFILKRPPQLID